MKSSSKKIIIASLVVVLILISGGLFWWYLRGTEERQATEIANQYVETLEAGDYEGLIPLLEADSITEQGYTSEEVINKYQVIFSAIQASNQKITDVQVEKEGGDFLFTYQLSLETMFGSLEKQYQTVINLNEEAKVEWSPALIFPEMSGQDKVMIESDPVTRGDIVDRNGELLATNQDYQQLGLNPSLLGEGEEREARLKTISELFSISIEQLHKSLEPTWAIGDTFVPVKILYGNEVVDRRVELPEGAIIGYANRRYYPLKDAAAHLIGYIGQVTQEDIENDPTLTEHDVIGKSGLEATFDQALRGESGGKIVITDEEGTEKETLLAKERKDPDTIQLTIDAGVQTTAFEALENKPGSTVVMQPQSGDLLATVSSPAYDPNQMMLGMTQEQYDEYAEDEGLPFLVRFTNRYAPGSTFKVITAAIGLDAEVIDPNEEVQISGLKWQKDASWGDYQVTRVKEASPINLEKALVYSDNIYFAQKTLDLGENAFREGLSSFIFGEELDLPVYMENASISNSDNFASEILLADTGYGQGELLLSPIHQVAMYSVFMNDGNLVYPRLTTSTETKTKADVISKESADTILSDLIHSVSDSDGYVHSLYNPNFVLSAKTGTAEIKVEQDTTGIENSFLLYFDTEGKQFMAITMLED
ncbi:MAG: penicillin-binding transpeptidase domain-containing protein, partial [Enterococcus sp.]|nr:penicillin-binding transpeptidase domain-containing protein [Enterococcus sp.]